MRMFLNCLARAYLVPVALGSPNRQSIITCYSFSSVDGSAEGFVCILSRCQATCVACSFVLQLYKQAFLWQLSRT